MKTAAFNSCLFSLFLFNVAAASDFHHPKYKRSLDHTNSILPGRFIVEYETQQHDNAAILNSFSNQFQSLKFDKPYITKDRKNFVTVQMNSYDNNNEIHEHSNYLQTLVDHDNVVAVYPVTYISRPNSISHGYYNNIDKNVTEAIQAHHLTQVDRLHKELGLTGKGVKVCIIDSGIDYNHPALGGGFGPNYRIQYGEDLVGDDFDPTKTNNSLPAPGSPPLDRCGRDYRKANGHGTHVTGIIAGNDTEKGFIGVAPNAIINAWRVFGCDGGTSSDIIMKAMIEAEKANCDVINMSLGNDAPWSEQPHAAFAQKLASQGISVVVSNGNDGEGGAFTVTDPAGAHDVLSVAAVSNANFLGSLFSLETSSRKKFGPFSYQVAPEAETEIPDGDVVLGGSPETFSACESDHLGDKDLKGKLALVHEGPCTITEQAGRVATAGAIGLIYYNSKANDPVRAPHHNTTIPIATISALSGHHLLSVLKNIDDSKDTVHMHFERSAFIFRSATAETIADFSSIGPTNELDMKPSFGAIGGNVYSTLPQYLGGWGTKSGTSMSAPYIAGTVALLREAFAGHNVLTSTIHEKLQNYGKPLNSYNNANILDSPLRQGSGIIQAYDAIKEPLHVSPGQISFNDTRSVTDEYKTHSLKVSNTGSEPVEYDISTISSASIAPYGQNNADFKLISYSSEKFYTNLDVEVNAEPVSVSLQPGESKQVVIRVKIPPKINENEQIMYGGFVKFKTSKSEAQVTIPYFGVLGSLYNLPTMDPATLNIKNHEGHIYSQNETYHFALSDPSTAPSIGFRLATPSRRFTIELIDAEDKHAGYIVPTYNYAERELSSQIMDELNPWLGKLVANENVDSKPFTVTPGTYKVRWSALRMFGDIEDSKDWVVQTSGPIEIRS